MLIFIGGGNTVVSGRGKQPLLCATFRVPSNPIFKQPRGPKHRHPFQSNGALIRGGVEGSPHQVLHAANKFTPLKTCRFTGFIGGKNNKTVAQKKIPIKMDFKKIGGLVGLFLLSLKRRNCSATKRGKPIYVKWFPFKYISVT